MGSLVDADFSFTFPVISHHSGETYEQAAYVSFPCRWEVSIEGQMTNGVHEINPPDFQFLERFQSFWLVGQKFLESREDLSHEHRLSFAPLWKPPSDMES